MTQRVVIVGGGVAGLSAALGLGRAGHLVTVVEGDALPAAADVEEAFAAERQGAAQVHQTHGFLARSRLVLRERFPDVLEDVLAAGGREMPTTAALGEPEPGDEDLKVLIMRRTTFELILRRAVMAETNVTLRTATRVIGLCSEGSSSEGTPVVNGCSTEGSSSEGVPVVSGVRIEGGEEIAADIVIAATGRRGPVPEWLEEVGAAITEDVRDSALMYLSRWYRVPDSQDHEIDPKLGGDLGYVKYLAVPGDGRTLSITLALRPGDRELRKALSTMGGFEEACRRLPGPRQFFDRGDLEPIGGVRPMGGLLNRSRNFLRDDRPVVLGFHAVGDAHTCTNPLYGRGCSLSLAQAVLLVDAVGGYPTDPAGRAISYEHACERDIEPWFHSAVELDRAGADPSGPGDATTSESGRVMAAVFAAAASDPVLGRGIVRFWNLLATPADLLSDPVLMGRIAEVMASPEDWPVPPREGPTRSELLDMLRSAA